MYVCIVGSRVTVDRRLTHPVGLCPHSSVESCGEHVCVVMHGSLRRMMDASALFTP
jgi:hypothetical protein